MDRGALEAVAREAVAALDPSERVAAALADLAGGDITLLALGKAAAAMRRGAERALGERVTARAVAGPEEGEHPVPGPGSEAAGRALLAAARAARGDRVVALVSGGGSALAEVPAPGLSLADLQAATRALLAGGAAIDEINTVRKHLSALKGGQLAAACRPPVTTLILSDVVSGDLAAVASGPTLPDATRREDAAAAIERYGLAASLLDHLVETPKAPRPGDEWRCVGDNRALVAAAEAAARRRGVVAARVIEAPLEGDVADVAARLWAEAGSGLIVGGGEATVTLPEAPGRGGRNTHVALLLARALAGTDGAALSVGSDGVDGASGASGGAVDGETWGKIEAAGIDAEAALERCDSATALEAAGGLIEWGATGVNVADLMMVWRP